MKKFQTITVLRSVLAFTLATTLALPQGLLAQTPQAPTYKPFTTPSNVAEAQITIRAAELRFLQDFTSPNADAEFVMLVHANKLTQLIQPEAVDGYVQFFIKNRQQLLRDSIIQGRPPLNWQLFLAQTYMLFQIEKTSAEKTPNAFIALLKSLVESPLVQETSWGTWVFVVGALIFIRQMVHGAVIAGPAAQAVNAVTSPIMTPLNQKLTVIGLRLFGRGGMFLNWVFFERHFKKEAKKAASELKTAGEVVESVRAVFEGRHYEVNGVEWAQNRAVLYKVWNRLQYLFGLTADAYRGGRSLMVDLSIYRLRDFANAATNSLNASEVQKQGVEQLLDRIIVKGAKPAAVEAAALLSHDLAREQINLEREAPERSSELNPAVEAAKQELIKLGASPAQADRIHENYRNSFAFKRQAATMLATQVLNDAMFSETIEGMRNTYEQMLKNTALNHMHDMLKFEVIDILKKMEFQIEIRKADVAFEIAAREKMTPKDLLKELTQGRESKRVLAEPGSLVLEPAQTGEQRAREAARGAGRR